MEALNQGLPCAAFSKRKENWYDRTILFDAASLPKGALPFELPDYALIEKAVKAYQRDTAQAAAPDQTNPSSQAAAPDQTGSSSQAAAPDQTGPSLQAAPVSLALADGTYSIEVSLSGGSGKSGVLSPTLLIVRNGQAYAQLKWSSANYDYMLAGGEKYLHLAEDGGYSVFEIPITVMDSEMPVIADTTAMGTPHEVPYTLTFYADSIGAKSQMPQEAAKRVILMALLLIVGGGILNHVLKKRSLRRC